MTKIQLNPKYKLADNIFGEFAKEPTRFGYGKALVELGAVNKNVVVLGADLTESTCAHWFKEKFPERFVEVGIAEQDMLCIAAGLSLAGKIPFVSTYGVFCTGRAWDQLRTTVCYGNLNVKLGSAHGGISVGADGATHQALEDIALCRVLPNMAVIVPADTIQARKATIVVANMHGPCMVRFGREKVPTITTEETPFEIGKAQVYKEGKDVSIFACGALVYEALIAAKDLEKQGINARVINMHTIKPIDTQAIIEAAEETGAIVTAEEHQVMCGFGSAIAEVVVKHKPVPMEMVGIHDRFGESGAPDELMDMFKLRSKDIAAAVKKVLSRK